MSKLAHVETCFGDFRKQFAVQNYGLAGDALIEAFKAAPEIGFRYFMVRASGAVATSLRQTRRSEDMADWLGEQLAGHPDMHLLVDYDPDLIRRIVDLREANITRGLPSVVHVSQGKSATIPVANIFNSGFNLPSFAYSLSLIEVIESWARDFARGGACYSTHLTPKPSNIQRLKDAGVSKVVVHVRDPRQALLSYLHHISLYPDQQEAFVRSGFADRSISYQIGELTEHYVGRLYWIQGGMDAAEELDILFSTFEDFVADREAFTRSYIAYYGHEQYFSWRDAMHVGGDQHFRHGRTDEWRDVFPSREAAMLTALMPSAMREKFRWAE